MSSLPAFPTETLLIQPWPDAVIDLLGHDPRSHYVETYWLGTLGPSTTWLLRRLVAGLDTAPDGYQLPLAETATSLGLGSKGGRHSPFVRALTRLVQFDLASQQDETVLAVRRKVPPLNRRQVQRLPPSLQEAHQRWQDEQLRAPAHHQQRCRGRQLALSLLELGEDREEAERQLLRWKYPGPLATEAAAWAWERHRAALAACAPGGRPAGPETGVAPAAGPPADTGPSAPPPACPPPRPPDAAPAPPRGAAPPRPPGAAPVAPPGGAPRRPPGAAPVPPPESSGPGEGQHGS
jgi:hypothetical protein